MTNAQRRWPPLAAAILTAVLVFLVLPNPLSIPQTNPSASAEYAPVPGDAQQADSANFSETTEATSAGVGAGGDGIGALPGTPPQKLPEFAPRQKNCVGNPPRQTEDPLSPPCVPFFEGENAGESYQGVTKDEIVVVLYNDRCCEGELNAAWKPSDEDQCSSVYFEECDGVVRTIKAFRRYFQLRYQTYGRTVRLIAQRSSGNLGGSCASRQGDAKVALRQWEPFAVVSFAQGGQTCYVQEMARNKVLVFGLNEDAPESLYGEARPFSFGFWPSQEVQIALSADFICSKLDGRTAKHAGDPLMRDDERRFGFIRPDGDSRGPELREQAALLEAGLKKRCDFAFDEVATFTASGTGAGSREASSIMTRFKQRGITTVVCYCIPRQTELTVQAMQSQATSAAYFPEWYWDAATQMERGIWQLQHGAREHRSMGATYLWRAPAFREQFHYQAYLSQEQGSRPAVYWSVRIYYLFMNLFSGIQAAGPDLTPETVQRGMLTFNFHQPENPWRPSGGYGAYAARATGDFTFVDTAMAVWWDPSGTQPGGPAGEGCMRVADQGRRVYLGEWPEGDDDLFDPSAPCTADLYKVVEPGSA